jgi:hypothetical protein
MLQTSSLLADSLANHLVATFTRSYGRTETQHAELLGEAARLVIERLSLSDALYHTAEHTVLVTLVAQDILRGRRLSTDVPPDMWLHVVLAALTHDIGYLRGVCQGRHRAPLRGQYPGRHDRSAARRLRRGAGALSRRPLQDLRARTLRVQSADRSRRDWRATSS